MKILVLRWKLFWHCYWPIWSEPMAYRVKLEWKKPSDYPPCYVWVNFITAPDGQKHRRVIGALQQYSIREALKVAAQQATDLLLNLLQPTEPAPFVQSAEPEPEHEASLELLKDSNYRHRCKCGWLGEPTETGHLCKPGHWCPSCNHRQWQFLEHAKYGTIPSFGENGQ